MRRHVRIIPPGPITIYGPASQVARMVGEAGKFVPVSKVEIGPEAAAGEVIRPCHCGWTGTGDHLCHRCGKVPGTERFYVPTLRASLAGAQPKASVAKTCGCDTCWEEFQALRKEAP